MELTHALLNLMLPPITAISILLILPAYLIFKLLNWIKKLTSVENVAGKVVVVTGAASGIGEVHYFYHSENNATLSFSQKSISYRSLRLLLLFCCFKLANSFGVCKKRSLFGGGGRKGGEVRGCGGRSQETWLP